MTSLDDKFFSVRNTTRMALCIALICVSAYIAIPVPFMAPLTMQTFVMCLAALVLTPRQTAVVLIGYTVLGATINMSGAAITIAILSLAAAHTLGIQVDLPTALLLCLIATVGACGASGVAGGSLLLIPVACSSFGISNDIAMQVVGVGFIIGVLQDSCETALNSSSDVLFTATAEFADRAKAGTLTAEDMTPKS